jgi:hypothetical protein
MRSSPVTTGVQNEEMLSVKITLAISVRMNAPAIVPPIPPRPPNRLVPPITSAATESRM